MRQAPARRLQLIECEHTSAAGRVLLRWELAKDRLRIVAPACDADGVNTMALPGTFVPVPSPSGRSEAFASAIPNAQGILHTGKGPAFYRPLYSVGHAVGLSLAMFGQLASRGGLLVIAETDADNHLHWEKTAAGDVRVMWIQRDTFGRLGYDREVVVMAVPSNLTSPCKTYRRYEIEKGRFKTWPEKIAERPVVEKLFGSCIAFIGYLDDPELDYADSLRRLKMY